MDKLRDHASRQLQLFGCEEPTKVVVAPTTAVVVQQTANVQLRLVPGSTVAQRLKVENVTAIQARLIGRTKFF